MKNRNISYYLQIISVILFFLTGCIDEDMTTPGGTDLGDEVELTFTYEIPGMETVIKTRMTDDQENTISPNDISVLVYEVNTLGEEIFAYHRRVVRPAGDQLSSGTFKVRLAKSKSGEKYTYDILFNTAVLTTGTTPLQQVVAGVTKREEVRELVKHSGTYLPGNEYLPMWGGIKKQMR